MRVPQGGRIAVAGDSFGGFVSAHVERTVSPRPDLQILIYPIVDMTLTSPSIDRYADGYLLTRSMMQWFRNNYLNADDEPSRHASTSVPPRADRSAWQPPYRRLLNDYVLRAVRALGECTRHSHP